MKLYKILDSMTGVSKLPRSTLKDYTRDSLSYETGRRFGARLEMSLQSNRTKH